MTDETKGTGVDLADLAQPANAERAVPEEARRAPQPEATTSSPMPPAAEVHSPDHGEAAGPEEPSRVVSALEAVFDVVTQFSVLEHEWHPLDVLRAAHRALKPGGLTVIKVPNHASWNRHIMRQDWCGYRLPDHCNYFTPRTLSAMLRKAGFTPLPGSILDRLPTSDSLWMAARKM